MILMLAPGPRMTYAGAPTGSVYVSDDNGLIRLINNSTADQSFLAGLGVDLLTAFGDWGSRGFLLLNDLYNADIANPFPRFTVASVFQETTASNGTWAKTGNGNGVGNWTQVSLLTLTSLQAQIQTLSQTVGNFQPEIDAETAAREAGDANLGNSITAESATRATNDADLQNQINLLNGVAHFASGGAAAAATTAPLPANTYVNGSSGVGATLTGNANGALPSQDGVAPFVGMRLLVWQEADATHNMLGVVTQVGSSGAPYIITRAADGDSAAELAGIQVSIAGGTTLSGGVYILPLPASAIVIGTTALVFAPYKNSGLYYQQIADPTALRALGASSSAIARAKLQTTNRSYSWSPTSTATDTGYEVIQANNVATGRWLLDTQATIIWVDPTNGNDANDGSYYSPVKTMTLAYLLADDGAVIKVVRGARITENVNAAIRAIGAGSIAGGVLTVTSIRAQCAPITQGLLIGGPGVTLDTTAVGTQISGVPGGAGTYNVSPSQTVSATTLNFSNQSAGNLPKFVTIEGDGGDAIIFDQFNNAVAANWTNTAGTTYQQGVALSWPSGGGDLPACRRGRGPDRAGDEAPPARGAHVPERLHDRRAVHRLRGGQPRLVYAHWRRHERGPLRERVGHAGHLYPLCQPS